MPEANENNFQTLSSGGNDNVEHALSVLDEQAKQERLQQIWAPYYHKKYQSWFSYVSTLLSQWHPIQDKLKKQEKLSSEDLSIIEKMKAVQEREFFLNSCHILGQACDNALRHAHYQESILNHLQIETRKRVAKERIDINKLLDRQDESASLSKDSKQAVVDELDLDDQFSHVKTELQNIREKTMQFGHTMIEDIDTNFNTKELNQVSTDELKEKIEVYTQQRSDILKAMREGIRKSSELQQTAKSILYKPVMSASPIIVGRPTLN